MIRTASGFVVFAIAVMCCMSCTRYNEYDPPRVGTFYPNGCVTVGGTQFSTSPRLHYYTICAPVRITEMGVNTYTREGGNGNFGDHEVARLDISGGLYVWTSTLNSVGRVESVSAPAGVLKRTERFVFGTAREGAARTAETVFKVILIIVVCVGMLAAFNR